MTAEVWRLDVLFEDVEVAAEEFAVVLPREAVEICVGLIAFFAQMLPRLGSPGGNNVLGIPVPLGQMGPGNPRKNIGGDQGKGMRSEASGAASHDGFKVCGGNVLEDVLRIDQIKRFVSKVDGGGIADEEVARVDAQGITAAFQSGFQVRIVPSIEQKAAHAGFQSALQPIPCADSHQLQGVETEHGHIQVNSAHVDAHAHEGDDTERLSTISDLEDSRFRKGAAREPLVGGPVAFDLLKDPLDKLLPRGGVPPHG